MIFQMQRNLLIILASKGMPFREAHEVVGKLVLFCVQQDCFLADLSLEQFKEASELFEEDIYDALNPYEAVKRRNSAGGTGFAQVHLAIKKAEQLLQA